MSLLSVFSPDISLAHLQKPFLSNCRIVELSKSRIRQKRKKERFLMLVNRK